jgi:hypothetical protein
MFIFNEYRPVGGYIDLTDGEMKDIDFVDTAQSFFLCVCPLSLSTRKVFLSHSNREILSLFDCLTMHRTTDEVQQDERLDDCEAAQHTAVEKHREKL